MRWLTTGMSDNGVFELFAQALDEGWPASDVNALSDDVRERGGDPDAIRHGR